MCFEPEHGPHAVESLMPGSARIDVHDTCNIVFHDPQDMRMSTYEHAWRASCDEFFDAGIESRRITGNVCHQNQDALAFEPEILRIAPPKARIIDVSVYRTERLKILQRVSDVSRTNIASMPYLVATGKKFEDSRVQKAVGVR